MLLYKFQVKQAIRIRQITLKIFDRVVQWKAGTRQDEDTNRWYLPISDYNLKQIRAKYWKSPGEVRVERTQIDNGQKAEKSDDNRMEDDFENLLKTLLESKVTSTDNVIEEMNNFKKEILDAVKSLKDEITQIKKQ